MLEANSERKQAELVFAAKLARGLRKDLAGYAYG